ncbi:Zinc finger protein ZPR1 [Portunus trituberculatus]|uniref:Zinc finger protein ZPR1 n=1 Tax=Portunus trituberculatus TaxID=210409 RepID=A0A5B7JDQ5_PORTR|nr:Zinc finger protein ZPR1 [Portunus trituberculatus]
MTRIPHLKEVILTSFECEHCGERNTGCQMGRWQEKGVRYQLQVRDERDLSRQVVKSGEATVCIPEVELEIPPNKEKGGECCAAFSFLYFFIYLFIYLFFFLVYIMLN